MASFVRGKIAHYQAEGTKLSAEVLKANVFGEALTLVQTLRRAHGEEDDHKGDRWLPKFDGPMLQVINALRKNDKLAQDPRWKPTVDAFHGICLSLNGLDSKNL